MKPAQHSIISGGSSGLGLGFALRLLRRGGRVSVLDLRMTDPVRRQLDEAAAGSGGAWQFLEANISDSARVAAAVQDAVQIYGAPQLAINSAGIIINKVLAETSAADFARVVDVNLNGSFNFAAAVLPTMGKGSRLALIASMAGLVSNYAYAAYGASKFGVVGLATTLRYEYEPLGIGISCICPPEVKTPMVASEHAVGNPVSLDLKKFAGSLEIDPACDAMLAGLDAGRWLIIPGVNSRVTAWAARYLPGPFYAGMHRLICRALRKHGQTASS